MMRFSNPIIKTNSNDNTSDPYVLRHEGRYYHCYSNDIGVFVAVSDDLWDIGNGERKIVYDCTKEGALKNWYAPELHRIDGKWFIYASPDYGNDLHVMTVLACSSESPMGEYQNLGMIKGLENQWSIDGTIMKHDNELYFIWTKCSEMFLSKMSDPCTLSGFSMTLTKPELDFETVEGLINEGPAVLYRGDKIHIVYSANDSRCDEYCLGMLTFSGDNVMDKKHWLKHPQAVLSKTDEIFGPGHCSFTTITENGKEIACIVYHANLVSKSGWDGRNVFVQPFDWDANDFPVFLKPTF